MPYNLSFLLRSVGGNASFPYAPLQEHLEETLKEKDHESTEKTTVSLEVDGGGVWKESYECSTGNKISGLPAM